MIPETTLEDFSWILREVRRMFPGSSPVIGGGALRDSFHKRPIKDVDVFLRAKDHPIGLDHPETSLVIPETISEYCGRPDLHGVWNVKDHIRGYEVQLIRSDFETPEDLAASFDIGLCRITYDGVVYIHPAFTRDSLDKKFRIERHDNDNEVARSKRRITRLRTKYPDFTEEGVETTYAHVVTPTKCPTCSGVATGFRNHLSLKEYEISGMCQLCQDSVFGED